MRKNSKYQEIVEAAKIADDSIVFFWQKMIDLDEQQQHFLRVNDQEGFKNTEKQKFKMIWSIFSEVLPLIMTEFYNFITFPLIEE